MVIKSRIVNLKHVTPQAVDAHLRYITRDGISHDGRPSQPYGAGTDTADWQEFAEKGRQDRHQFRFIVAPEDGVDINDLRAFTRQLMSTMQEDLATKLDWIAVDHWDTDNPHTHVVLRGKDDQGKDLIISRKYMTDGMRLRACELSTDWLGPRTRTRDPGEPAAGCEPGGLDGAGPAAASLGARRRYRLRSTQRRS